MSNTAPEGHPIHTLMEEHVSLTKYADNLVTLSEELKQFNDYKAAVQQLTKISEMVTVLRDSQKHYLREENVVFPYLEKYGITGPTAQMWNEHDQVRATEKEIIRLIKGASGIEYSDFAYQLVSNCRNLRETLLSHFHKENNILFPMALQNFTDEEWEKTLEQFSQIGYCGFSPQSAKDLIVEASEAGGGEIKDGQIDTGSGKLSPKEMIAMLDSLPVEITFVDKNDIFRYFNKIKDQIFARTVASVGLPVQNCHPGKSVHKVNEIIAAFRSGKKDEVSFWIPLGDKFVYIRYFAVRDASGEYLGCMEVTMDLNKFADIKGEKRLMD